MGEAPDAGRAVDLGRLIKLLRDRHPAGEQDHGPERHVLPDVGDDDRAQRQPARGVEPARSVDVEKVPQHVVDQAPLGVQHPVDRDEGRQRRHRPGQHVDHQQALDPPALAHEEAGQQQREEHLHVDADRPGRGSC